MDQQRIEVGPRLNETTALQLAADLNLLQPSGAVTLDFAGTTHFEPFAMLLVSSAVRRLRDRMDRMGFPLTIPTARLDREGIAAHMAFWQSMGVDLGREVSSPAGRDSYLPITRIGIDAMYRESGGANPLAAGIIEHRARQLAQVLAQPRSDVLLEAITYALRELIRNVVEHAMSPSLWIAGMSWPKRDYVQVAVLDEGRGIRRSLADHREFRYANDLEAVRAALRPGVSRNLGRQPSAEEQAKWQEEGHGIPQAVVGNAGYGLYMISSLCREAGQFMVATGTSALAYIGGAEVQGATAHQGTALRLVLQPSDVPAAWDRVFAELPHGPKPLLSASTLRRLGLGGLAGTASPQPAGPSTPSAPSSPEDALMA